jgi:hypothetical protein
VNPGSGEPAGVRVASRLLLVGLSLLMAAGLALAPAAAQNDESADAIRVAYPEEPTAWHPGLSDLPATVDVAALWGLPLYRIDDRGQLRPALAERARVDPGEGGEWAVEIALREGRWSDDRPIVAADVVATVDALRAAAPEEMGPLAEAVALSDRRVRFVFERPYARWPWLLAGGWSVLPAHVLADGGLDRYADAIPVSGGPYRLESVVPGLRARFVGWDGGPLGAPTVDRVDVYWTPSYETALGLLRDDRVDAVLGYLALNPVGRAARVDGALAAAPLGGSTVSLRWDAGALGGSEENRQAARDVVDVGALVEGLFGDAGEVMTGPVPGRPGPWEPTDATIGADGTSASLLAQGPQEAVAFTSRALFRDLVNSGTQMGLVRADHGEAPDVPTDATLVVRRDPPFPALVPRLAEVTSEQLPVLWDGEGRSGELLDGAQSVVHQRAYERPLYRAPVAHAWREDLVGLTPSGWSGLAFWDAPAWEWDGGEPPERAPTMDGP